MGIFKESKNIKSTTIGKNNSVLGVFTGKCCDSNVFNNNDMHLSRELFEKLMKSEDYKRAMENHHYIGYLGHPEDSDCQDYEHACIVMKDMRIADNGEIEGDFDLVNTPVGRIVKSFIDAGVKFGISIRGLGDVDGNGEVSPDEFIFRGFDLVTFPAYNDCIPEFREIAASTDARKQAQYKKVCAAIDANIKDIRSCETLEMIKEQLPTDCTEIAIIDDRIAELQNTCDIADTCDVDYKLELDVTNQKLAAMTELYLDAVERARQLEQQLTTAETSVKDITLQFKTMTQKHSAFKKLVANQLRDADDTINKVEAKYNKSQSQLKSIKASLIASERKNENMETKLCDANDRLDDIESELRALTDDYNKEVTANESLKKKVSLQITANKSLKSKLDSLSEKYNADKDAVEAANSLNLKYKQKIEAHSEAISQKDSTIEELKSKLNETVVASRRFESEASNLDEKNGELLSRVEAAEEMVMSYQQAYADMYANALGVYLPGLPITASTSVEELKEMIKSGTSTANIASAPSYSNELVDEEYVDDENFTDLDEDVQYSAGMVTL